MLFFSLCSSEEDLNAILSDLDLSSRALVVFVVNNNKQNEAGGSHWSLLCFERSSEQFFHFDSMHNSNARAAMAIERKITKLLQCEVLS